MQSLIPPLLVVYLLSAGITAAVAAWALQRHRERGAIPFGLQVGAMSLWSIGISGMLIAPTLEQKMRWLLVQDIAMFSVAVNWLLFTLTYTYRWRTHALDRRALLLWVPVGIGMALNATNPLHRLMYADWRIEPTLGGIQLTFGPAYWFSTVYALTCGIIGMVVIARNLGPVPGFFRQYKRLLLGCGLSVLLVDAIRFSGLFPLELTPVVIALFAVLMATRYSRNLIFGVVPIARPLVVNSMNEGIILLSASGVITSLNPAAERLLSLKTRLVAGQPAEVAFQAFPLLAGGGARPGQQMIMHVRDTGGQQQMLEVREHMLLRRDGTLNGRLLLLRDVTARESARENALILTLEQRRRELMSAFITGAAHEFRTPLSVIRASAYLASRGAEPAFRKSQHDKISGQVAKLDRLIDQMQMMMVLDAGAEMELEVLEVDALIREAIHRCAALGAAQRVSLVPVSDLPPLRGDARLLALALEEVLRNALMYSPADRPVVVSALTEEGLLCVRVTDNGDGIAPPVRERMFERLFRGDPARSTPGFGLGLSIVRSVLEAHHGRVEVDSPPEGGTVVRVLLPPHPSHEHEPAGSADLALAVAAAS
jgi:signal transduction histidine kinase